jgi:hypothetical protein
VTEPIAAGRNAFIKIVLALAVLAASIAWRPVSADSPLEVSASSLYKARLVGVDLVVDGKRVPDQRAFFVKVRRNIGYKWVRLGALQSNDAGELHGRFVLPKELRKAQVARVCLKDIYNDQVFCTFAWR